jgi:hypothetical protein
MNQINCHWQEWRNHEAYLLRVASACIEPIKSLSDCSGLYEFQQIDLIERIDIADVPPNDIRSALTPPNRLILIDRPSRRQAKRTDKHSVLAASTCSHINRNIMNGYWTVQHHRDGTRHVSTRNRIA